ncbi:hypothetical protein IWW50_006955 [Coemansia erecta]|nr:hypothetical protein IWW50_006955 [Coemansia erecta]
MRAISPTVFTLITGTARVSRFRYTAPRAARTLIRYSHHTVNPACVSTCPCAHILRPLIACALLELHPVRITLSSANTTPCTYVSGTDSSPSAWLID